MTEFFATYAEAERFAAGRAGSYIARDPLGTGWWMVVWPG